MTTTKTYVGAKLHGIRVTDASVEYNGSVSIDRELMERAGIDPYEQVHVVNLENGNRWVTYALEAGAGAFTLNGGGAHLGAVGDRCVVMSFVQDNMFIGARVLFLNADNQVRDTMDYGW